MLSTCCHAHQAAVFGALKFRYSGMFKGLNPPPKKIRSYFLPFTIFPYFFVMKTANKSRTIVSFCEFFDPFLLQRLVSGLRKRKEKQNVAQDFGLKSRKISKSVGINEQTRSFSICIVLLLFNISPF